MEERLYKFNIIIYGVAVGNITYTGSPRVDGLFQVMCVLKGDNHIKENITINEIYPETSCSRTNEHVEMNVPVIVGLKKTSDGNYHWDELNLESAAFEGTDLNLRKAATVCGVQAWKPPKDNSTTTGCPPYVPKSPCTDATNAITYSMTLILSVIILNMLLSLKIFI